MVNFDRMTTILKVGIIDADLLGRTKHRFPNLACEKISGYWKERGAEVKLLLDYDSIDEYDHVYISKVFTDTPVPAWLKETEKIHLGGTGFYFEDAPNLPDEIEHHMPDYHLYDDWISSELAKAEAEAVKNGKIFKKSYYLAQFKEYLEYSIGFITRGCFRKCEFCVNKKYNKVFFHSPLNEFFDPTRKKICLLDDNFLGFHKWKQTLQELINTGRRFKFKQGLDERILTDEKCKMLFNSKYDGDFTFAFDNINDYEIIREKLKLIRRNTTSTNIKFYVLVGFKSVDENDIAEAFERLKLLMEYQCLPYVMRYRGKDSAPWKSSRYRGMYVAISRWANQPGFFKKLSFREFCEKNQEYVKTDNRLCSSLRSMREFEDENREIAEAYFDLKFSSFCENI